MKLNITISLMLLTNLALAQTINFWQDISETEIVLPREAVKEVKASEYRALSLELAYLQVALRNAPLEFSAAAKNKPLRVVLPLPDGTSETFEVVESPIMEPGLAARYPNIKTYKGRSVNDRAVMARFGHSDLGFHAVIKTAQGQVYIDPLVKNYTQYYQAYYTKNAIEEDTPMEFSCGTPSPTEVLEYEEKSLEDNELLKPRSATPVNLYTYRLAVTTSGEFAQRFGATTKAQVMMNVVNILNKANAVFETDVAIRLVLVANTDTAFFLDAASDPFTDGSSITAVYQQVAAVLDANIGMNNYDVGHALIGGCGSGTVGIGGGDVCNNNGINTGQYKGFGASCIFSINVSSIEIFAHELGHQFSAQHTWSNCPGSEGQLASGSAYEPGGGTTIMSYTNACGNQTVQSNADAYFHTKSLQEIISYSRVGAGSSCASISQTNNDEPEVALNYKNNFYIPIRTPFELNASATDVNNDPLTYCWEQFDLGPMSPLGSPTGNAPSFRSFAPKSASNRIFPRIENIVNNTSSSAEVLPTYDRTLTFRCTVRDNHPGAGVSVWKQVQFKSTSSAGPFLVLHPNEDTVKWRAGTYAQVRWDVAKTNNNLVNCQAVTIKLSVDGGFTYPITLVEAVPNNGSAMVPIPDVVSNKARIRVEASDNIFFDISNQNFEIQAATQPSYTLAVAPRTVQKHCLPEPLQFAISSAAFLGFNSPISLEIIDTLPDEVEVSLSKTSIQPNESAMLTVNFTKQLEGTFNLQVKATANGQSISLPVSFSTISNDFSDLNMLAPTNGQTGIVLSSQFRWNRVSSATLYDFELATSPAFGPTVIASAVELQDTFFTPEVFFEENQLYFWRIRPYNKDCNNLGEFLEPFAFHTATVQCETTQSANVPILISGSGLPTINSTLNVTNSGVINDINIPLIRANYQPVKSIRVSLISPAGTEVNLYDQSCGNTLKFETGFDDESPTAITCPPDDRLVVRPAQSLAAFIGENKAGTWTLRIKVVTSGFGSGGALEAWGVQFCSTFSPNNPFVVRNDTLFVPPSKTNTFTINELEVQDTDNSPVELVYTLVTLPQHGTLKLNGIELQVGNTFTQLDVNSFRLQYTHNGDNSLNDNFAFVVEDGTGGFLATQRAQIKIDENATVDADDVFMNNTITVFPNPAQNLLNVHFEKAPKGSLMVSLYNVQGQELLRQRIENAENQLQLNTTNLSSGMYYLSLRAEGGVLTKKVSIQK